PPTSLPHAEPSPSASATVETNAKTSGANVLSFMTSLLSVVGFERMSARIVTAFNQDSRHFCLMIDGCAQPFARYSQTLQVGKKPYQTTSSAELYAFRA